MNAAALGFAARTFDAVVCIQNGIAVFGVDRRALVEEAWSILFEGLAKRPERVVRLAEALRAPDLDVIIGG